MVLGFGLTRPKSRRGEKVKQNKSTEQQTSA
jgi:hypothetical protein